MATVNFNKARPIDVERYDNNLYYRHNSKWLCLATNCKHLLGFGDYHGFKYVDSDEYLHHFYNEYPKVKEEIDLLNDDSKLRSDNPYIKKRVG